MQTGILIDQNKTDTPADFVIRIFAALDRAGITYALLRGYDELFTTNGFLEIDLLTQPDQSDRLEKTVTELGFVELPSWGHRPHRFFFAYNKPSNSWVKLDVVTELCYGNPIRRFRIDLAKSCLAERKFQTIYTLSPAHEFFTLLLHGLLDKGEFRKSRGLRLIELRQVAADNIGMKQKINALIQQYLAPVFSWEMIDHALVREDWPALLRRCPALIREFRRREPLTSVWRDVSSRVLRRLRPLFFAFSGRGFSVALLAPDGAGKSTLSSALADDPILKARRIYMGGNLEARTIGLPTTAWLHRRLKAQNGKTGGRDLFHSFLQALNFCNKLLEQWLRTFSARYHLLHGRIVIFDRYVYDSWMNKKSVTLWKRLRRVLFESQLPKPDLVILLDAPGEVLFERKGEHTAVWLEEQRQRYLALRERIPHLYVVDASQPAEQVKNEAIDLIWKHVAAQINLRKYGNRTT